MKRVERDIVDADCLLKNLKNGMELVASTEEKGVGLTSLVVRSVTEILNHGLRVAPVSFWHIVRDLTHSCARRSIARALKHIGDNRERGQFWVYYMLVEGSLDSYMHCLVSDKHLINKHYLDYALLRDNFCATKFILLLTSLAQINITPLDSTTCVGLRLDVGKSILNDSSIISTPSSGISSPGDSGLHESMEEASDSVFLANKELVDSTVEAFSDCSLSGAGELPLATVRRRKRVSFHETVMGDGPKGTVWERRSCDVETMAWWRSTNVGEKAEDALNMERGAPEGSENPEPMVETKPEPAQKPKKQKMRRTHLMRIYPGPFTPDPVHFDELEMPPPPPEIKISGVEHYVNASIYKMYNMIDSEGKSYLCFLTKQELCFLTLTARQTVNMHRIFYRDMEYIGVGPSPEHITLQDGKKFLLTTRGEDFCSWLHHAVFKETSKTLDFIRVNPQDIFAAVMAQNTELKAADIIYSTWAVICDPFKSNDTTYKEFLMFSFAANSGYWEPALIEINSKYELEVKPCSKDCRNLRLPLSECSYCDRYLTSGRPYTFKLRFDRKSPRDQLFLYLATPDSDSMASWMQAILLAVASKKNWNRQSVSEDCEGHHLVATDKALALVNAQRDLLVSKVMLRDVSSILTGPAYLVLELGCFEVEDKANDWVLYFYSDEIKTSFLDFVNNLRPELVKMTYKHKEVSCNWAKCEEERNGLDKQFQNIISYLTSL